jgi:hypothetical protein
VPDLPPWSLYDAAVPHTTGLPRAQAVFDALRPVRQPPVDDPLAAVGDVVVVVSASRGGSTLFAEILRRSEGLLHLRAEVNPLFVVAGLAGGDTAVLAGELAAEIGTPASAVGQEELEDLALAVAWRLTAQWPALGIDPEEACGWVRRAAAEAGRPFDHTELHLRVLELARQRHPGVNPHYYDLPADVAARRFPDAPVPSGPPGERLVEMPPFVLVRPWRRPDRAALASRPLVLSTPRNAFRLRFLRMLFPAARFRVVHLTRNPAASVNGLVDGWLHHGFFNVALDVPLRIAGYTDAFPRWGDRWWCYDFPPAWRTLTDAALPEVCAEQWRSHHQAVLDFLAETGVESRRVRFEDVVGPRRQEVFAGLGEWLGTGSLAEAEAQQLPPLMATAPPARRRWERRAAVLGPALSAAPVVEMADALGYGDPDTWA